MFWRSAKVKDSAGVLAILVQGVSTIFIKTPYRTAPPNIRIRIRPGIIRIATARTAIRRIIPVTAEQETGKLNP